MSGFPWMKWYPRDFASATRGWPLVARGAFRELLDAQWDMGGSGIGTLPDDPDQLRNLAGALPPEWKVVWPLIESKFPLVEGGGRRNAKLEEHRTESVREFAARRKGAAATNLKRWGTASGTSPSDSGSES